MNPLIREQKTADGRVRHLYWCPGCGSAHGISIRTSGDRGWTFDGNFDAPTYSPSQLTRYGYSPRDKICHTFIRGGRIEYLSDCTHELAGKTVDMVPLPDWLLGK